MKLSKKQKEYIKQKSNEYVVDVVSNFVPRFIEFIKRSIHKRRFIKRQECYIRISNLAGHNISEDFIKDYNGGNHKIAKYCRRWLKWNKRLGK